MLECFLIMVGLNVFFTEITQINFYFEFRNIYTEKMCLYNTFKCIKDMFKKFKKYF